MIFLFFKNTGQDARSLRRPRELQSGLIITDIPFSRTRLTNSLASWKPCRKEPSTREVKAGSFALETPTGAELAHHKRLKEQDSWVNGRKQTARIMLGFVVNFAMSRPEIAMPRGRVSPACRASHYLGRGPMQGVFTHLEREERCVHPLVGCVHPSRAGHLIAFHLADFVSQNKSGCGTKFGHGVAQDKSWCGTPQPEFGLGYVDLMDGSE